MGRRTHGYYTYKQVDYPIRYVRHPKEVGKFI